MPLYLFVFTKVSQKFKLIEICFDDDEKPKRLKDEVRLVFFFSITLKIKTNQR